ncbi:hypothetical protein KY358_01000 [Candidatus Woesearchaeota archaeon]|nr:hypothetical protein [Candidatus Woesearchaeota archaeon]
MITIKSIAHAWVGLMALERLKAPKPKSYLGKEFKPFFLGKSFNSYYNKQAEIFAKFFDKHKDSFVQGAWFPDNVISDNLAGGHTLKLKKPANEKEKKEAKGIKNTTPEHLSTRKTFVNKSRLTEEVYVKEGYILPDRCEALSHAIRDMVLIQKHEQKGSGIMFNDGQLTLYFLMLSHYLADAHVPPHSDARDFYTPPTIHPDMEGYWDKEIMKFYSFDKKRKVFDYDIDGSPELQEENKEKFKESFLYEALKILSKRKWNPADKKAKYLGKNNKKIYDYAKAVCFDSYLVSTWFIPELSEGEYKKIKILKDEKYKEKLRDMSVHILADAIDSIALVWLLTWDKYNKLKEEIKKKEEEIKKGI